MTRSVHRFREWAARYFIGLLVLGGVLIGAPASAAAATETIAVPGDYSSVADAADAVRAATVSEATDFTISVAPGTYSDQIEILQQENKSIVIRATGPGVIFTNSVLIDGDGRWDGAETFELEGVTFEFPGGGSTARCITTADLIPNTPHGYAHNVSITGCAFTGDENTVGVTVTSSSTGNCNGLTITDCTATNVHSLLQATGGTTDITITDCTVTNPTGGRGINASANGNTVITDCTFDVMGGYAIRLGSGSDGAALVTSGPATITNCYLASGATQAADDEGTFVTRGSAQQNITVNNCTLVNNADGYVYRNANVSRGDEFVLDLGKNYWGEHGCESGFFTGLSDTQLNSIDTYFIRAMLDANGGTFSDGSTVISASTAPVPTTDATKGFSLITMVGGMTSGKSSGTGLPIPAWGARPFLGYYTDPLAGTLIYASDETVVDARLGDMSLYAHWGEAPSPPPPPPPESGDTSTSAPSTETTDTGVYGVDTGTDSSGDVQTGDHENLIALLVVAAAAAAGIALTLSPHGFASRIMKME